MLARDSEDKNHLAMLAVPVILAMLIGFSGDARAGESFDIQEGESGVEESSTQGSEKTNPTSEEYHMQDVAIDDVNKRRKELEKAVVDGDYERFLKLSNDAPFFSEIMTEMAFNEVVARYRLHESGYRVSRYPIS